MTKFYITFTKTINDYDWGTDKRKWYTTKNCIAAIDADTEEEAIDKLLDTGIEYDGDKITNIKISATNPMF